MNDVGADQTSLVDLGVHSAEEQYSVGPILVVDRVNIPDVTKPRPAATRWL